MKLDSLQDLLVDELKDLYSAENQLVKALPKMAKAASSPDLRAALKDHLAVTCGQVRRLEKVFKQVSASPRGKKCKGMEGLIEEGNEIMHEDGSPAVLDAAIIGAAQRVEHYEMAGYGCVRTYAKRLGYTEAARLLQQTLDEEAEADKTLTALAEGVINAEAEEAGDGNGQQDQGLVGKVTGAASMAAETVGDLVKSASKKMKRAVTGKRRR
jgi:ferritin-like metal-binding protein YciE